MHYLSGLLLILATGATALDFSDLSAGRQPDGSYHAWVYFTDKGTPLPAARLSDRAWERRCHRGSNGTATFRDAPLKAEYVAAVRREVTQVRCRSRWLNAVSVRADRAQLEALARRPFVARIAPVLSTRQRPEIPERATTDETPPDTTFYGYACDQIHQIKADSAHAHGYYGQGVLILMLDTGYNLAHPAFDSLDIVAQWDFIQGDSITANQEGDSAAQHYHGTYTFSALAGYAPGYLIGPAYGAQFLLAKTEIQHDEIELEEDLYVAGLEWGDSLGADVATSSLGYYDWYTYADMDGNTAVTTIAVDYAVSIGIACVTSAGNEAQNDWHYIIAPADADSVIAVGAVDANGFIAVFSSRGPTYDGRLKPEVCARGVATACASPFNENYLAVSGTSLSAPLVAGATALVLCAHPDWTPMQVRDALLHTADRADHPDTIYGHGVIDVWAAINHSVGTDPETGPLPTRLTLTAAWPNPFNPAVNLLVTCDRYGAATLRIYNLRGQAVATVFDGRLPAGNTTLRWDGGNAPSGVYFARLCQGNSISTKKIVLLK